MVVERRPPRKQSPQGQPPQGQGQQPSPQHSQHSQHSQSSLRKPLHERSHSQSNERSQRSSPDREFTSDYNQDLDLKTVAELDSQRFYSASPFPTRPSQILPPKAFNLPGYVSVSESQQRRESEQERVSDSGPAYPGTAANTSGPPPQFDLFDDESLKPARLSPKPKCRNKGKEKEKGPPTLRLVDAPDSTGRDAAYFRADPASHPGSNGGHTSPHHGAYGAERNDPGWPLCPPKASSLYSPPPRASRSAMQDEAATGLGISHPHKAAHASQPPTAIAIKPTQSQSPTLSPFTPAKSPNLPKGHVSVPSPSLGTADSVKGPQYSPFPSARASLRRRSSSVTALPPKANPQRSTDSLTSVAGPHQTPDSRRSVSLRAVPSDHALEAAVASGATVQYPLVRPPSAHGSWADSSITIPKRPRMNERTSPRLQQWNAQMSTIQSESERASRHTSPENRSPVYASPKSTEFRESGTSFIIAKIPSDSALNTTQRQFAEGQRNVTGSTIRVVYESDEHGDTVQDLRPQVLESPRNPGSELHRADSSSRGSFISSGIPLWARYFHRRSRDQGSAAANKHMQKHSANRFQRIYYGRGGPDSLGAPGSSIDGDDSRPSTVSRTVGNLPLGIFRTRARADSDMEIRELPPNVEIEITGPPRSRAGSGWSPRLHQDRRAKAMSVWQAPPLKGKSSGGIFGRMNVQIVLFCLGFVFPLAWMIAAFLPLPPYPDFMFDTRTSRLDYEGMIARDAASIEKGRYERARWWRNVNRVMSVVGLLIIGAIAALTAVAVHMRDD
ncbi:MAG: hypothetical protein M1839_001190 [Geoglossum umbratile]|nr:MAG: hypothetical protein M1839_001190 [Geoglossum umbratile]